MSGGALALVEAVIRPGDLLPPTEPEDEVVEPGDNTFPTAGGVKLPFTDAGVFDLLPLARLLGLFSSNEPADDDEDELVNGRSVDDDDAGIVIFFSMVDDELPFTNVLLLLLLGLGDTFPVAVTLLLPPLLFDFLPPLPPSPFELDPLFFLPFPVVPPTEEADDVERSEEVEEVPAVPVPESRPDEDEDELEDEDDDDDEDREGQRGLAFGGSAPIWLHVCANKAKGLFFASNCKNRRDKDINFKKIKRVSNIKSL